VENVRVIPSLNLNKKSKQVGESIADQQARIANEKKVNDAKKRVTEINKMKIQDNVKLSNYLNIKRPDKNTAAVEKKQAVSTQHTVKKPVVLEPMSKEAVAKGKQMSNTLVDRFAKDKSKSKITSMAEAEKLIKYRKTSDELEEEVLKAKYIVKPSTTKEAASKELDKNAEEAVHNKTFGIKTGKQLDTIIDDSKSQPVKQEEKQVVKQVVKQKEKAEPKVETKEDIKEDIKAKVAREVKEQNYLKIPDKEAPKMSMKEDVVEKIVTNKVDKEEPKVAPKERRINPALLAEQERLKGSEDEAGGGVFTSNTEDKEK
jgi:hypothetical protein